MRGSRAILTIVCASAVSLAACSRQQEQPVAPPAAEGAAPSASTATAPPPVSEAPAESGLSIKRGIAMLAHDRTTFRPCDEKDELWLLDQTDGVLARTFAGEMHNAPVRLYIEAYGERAPVAEDIAPARAYAGTFVLEQVLYAGMQEQVRGCAAPAQDYIVAARGNEPFWAAEVRDAQLLWRQPQAPKEIDLGAPETQSAEGAVRYRAGAAGRQLELLIDARTCRDSMSGEYFAYAAQAVLDGRKFTGCARVGR